MNGINPTGGGGPEWSKPTGANKPDQSRDSAPRKSANESDPVEQDAAHDLQISVQGRVVSVLLDDKDFANFVQEHNLPDPRTQWESFLEQVNNPQMLTALAACNIIVHAIVTEELRKRRKN